MYCTTNVITHSISKSIRLVKTTISVDPLRLTVTLTSLMEIDELTAEILHLNL